MTYNILLVNIPILENALIHGGYTVTLVDSGFSALNAIRQEPFDLVLMAFKLPNVSGLDMLRKVREELSMVELPVIMFLASPNSLSMVQCLKTGANDCIDRSVDPNVVLARVNTVLRLKEVAKAQTGELHKLINRSSSQSLPSLAVVYCLDCMNAYRGQPRTCPACGAPRPQKGWPGVEESPHSYLGKTLGGRYFLERYISKGSMGEVYRARDIDTERKFAVKVVDFTRFGQTESTRVREQVLREIQALACLTNPHIVRLYQMLVPEDNIWAMVMEFCRGQTLEEVIQKRGKLKPELALDITRQVALALYDAHKSGLLHRDIKPENIMIEQMTPGEHFVRVLDFSIAQTLGYLDTDESSYGTPAYLAPELIQGNAKVDARSDIYALGASLYQMLTGHPPFRGGTINEVLIAQYLAPIPSLGKTLDDNSTTRALDKLIAKMLAKTPDDRFHTVEDLLSALSVSLG